MLAKIAEALRDFGLIRYLKEHADIFQGRYFVQVYFGYNDLKNVQRNKCLLFLANTSTEILKGI